MNIKAIVLAAGQGTRMKSEVPKVMHEVCNLPIVEYVVSSVEKLFDTKPVIVVGHKSEEIIDYLGDRGDFVFQTKQLGTAHAVMMAREHIKEEDIILVICGDTPLIKNETLIGMRDKMDNADAIILVSTVNDPYGYGRIFKTDKSLRIIEEKDASVQEKKINLINAGTYMIKGDKLLSALDQIDSRNSQNEYYLTDVFNFIKNVDVFETDENEILGINSRVQLALANEIMRKRINEYHMSNGVTLINPEATYIDSGVTIGTDTIIYPNVHLRRNTVIGQGCIIYENSTITASNLGNNVTVKASQIVESKVGDKTTIGPYAYLRPGSNLGEGVKIGDFVEVKNATLGDGSKAAHLSYIGDAIVGKNVNISCGVVFVNYDGKNKFVSNVKDDAFIGSNSNIIAPVTIGERAYVATGTTVTIDIPQDALCIGRSRETIKANWKRK